MPAKREVIALLSRDERGAIAERFDLAVADRRKHDLLLDAVVASKKATLAGVLPSLPSDRLKESCRAPTPRTQTTSLLRSW